MPARGLIIGAPASGSGKTVFTLGLLRHCARSGVAVTSAKVGPDYIDPCFHTAASGRPCLNLDVWAMRPDTLRNAAMRLSDNAELVVCEGVMGLFDGATASEGSTADIAAISGWPVLLILDVRAQAASAAAVLRGFVTHRADVHVAGVVFNRVGGERHAAVLREACALAVPEVPVLGAMPRAEGLMLPERHLGLVQAVEHPHLQAFLEQAADLLASHVDLDVLLAIARPGWGRPEEARCEKIAAPVSPLGRRIAVADDAAFAFRYQMVVDGWRQAGCEVIPFSPLADEAPDASADAVYLPGGYPELHAGRLAGNSRFLAGLRDAARRDATVFGECGGYMVMGEGLIDADGVRHAMSGLLPLETSFAERGLHLGYRDVSLAADGPLGAAGSRFRGHEFHYARTLREGPGQPLFYCRDAALRPLGSTGLAAGRVMGSFIHLIDRAPSR